MLLYIHDLFLSHRIRMQKFMMVILGLIVIVAGYLVYQNPESGPTESDENVMMENSEGMVKEEDAMMKKDEGMVKEEDAMMKKDEGMVKDEDAMMKKEEDAMTKGAYLAYSDGVIGNGKTSVLFFHAAWCPACRQGDKDLAGIYGAGTAGINTYKVDYDTATALKSKYGVTSQHTFVLIDGTGKALKTMVGATASQLSELVKG
jgi:thiol-disulfide isomerase/thioredoxin